VEIVMPTLAQPRLNRSFVLRYDQPHATDSEESDAADKEFDAQIDAIISLKSSVVNSRGADYRDADQSEAGDDHMDVNGISGVGRAQPLGGVRPTHEIETPAASALAPQDEVQISSAAQAMDELSQTADVRMERIKQIQQEIADGVYDSEDKMDAALDRFLDAYGLNDD
jgi:anti-sigma28 factor (negative regulator of flagellin synthesis)